MFIKKKKEKKEKKENKTLEYLRKKREEEYLRTVNKIIKKKDNANI